MKDKPYAVAQHIIGERGWEIVEFSSRDRICADMREGTARAICALINEAYPLVDEHHIPVRQIAAIWRLVKDNGGIDAT